MEKQDSMFTLRVTAEERAELEALKALYRSRSTADAIRRAVRDTLLASGGHK